MIAARERLPRARAPARHARPARGVPRARSSSRSSRGYARGETPNPCVRCNGSFRFDELLAFADRIGAARLATGHYARIVERDGRRAARARGRRRARTRATCSPTRRPGRARPGLVPARRPDEGARRAPRPRPPGSPPPAAPRARRRASSAATTTATSSGATASRPRPGRVVDEAGARARRATTASGASRPGQRRGLGDRRGRAALRARAPTPRTNTVVVGPRASLARTRVAVRGRLRRARDARRGEAPLPLARASRRPSTATRRRLRARASTSRPTASRPGRPPCSTRTTPSSASGVITVRRRRTKIAACSSPRRSGTSPYLALTIFLVVVGLGLGWAFFRLGGDLLAPLVVHPRNRAGAAAGDQQDRADRSTA